MIKVDQTDNAVVKEEIEEYVATDQIRRYYLDVLERFGETPNKPHEGIGIWISGFFRCREVLVCKDPGLRA